MCIMFSSRMFFIFTFYFSLLSFFTSIFSVCVWSQTCWDKCEFLAAPRQPATAA